MAAAALGGGMALVCVNCMSVPLCLVGLGLAIVGMVAAGTAITSSPGSVCC